MRMTVTISEARAELPKLIDSVEEGHEVTITRHGKAVAVLMSRQAARRHRTAKLEEGVSRLQQVLEEERGKALFEGPGLTTEYADELVRHIRAERDAED